MVMELGLEQEKRGYSIDGREGAEVLTLIGAVSFSWASRGIGAFKTGLRGREGNLCFRDNSETGNLPYSMIKPWSLNPQKAQLHTQVERSRSEGGGA